jgi:tetratricopeptide (TPR) repeat protein
MPAAHGTRFVGRHAELEVLRTELDAALAGEGRLVVLLGEPGIGKTRTATAIAAEARARGTAVVWGRCHESDGAPVYWPWVQALSAYIAEYADDGSQAIEGVLPALRSGTGLADAREVFDQARFELVNRVVAGLGAAARTRPVLVVLDDLHWADAGSLLLLEFVARELGSLPLLVLGTARDVQLTQRPDLAALLAAAVRLGRSLPLVGLPGPEMRDLLTDRIGRVPEDELVDEVMRLTDGNPFFGIELVQWLAAERIDVRGLRRATPVPPGVQELLRQRLEPLPAATRRVLDLAAVIGRDFDLAPLAAALGEPSDALLNALAPSIAASIVRERSGALRRYAFTHALMRENVYKSLAPSARSALHAAIGAALEAAGPRNDVERSALAHHFFEAAQAGGDPAKAIRYGCEAGERALDVLAFEEAVRHFERALAAAAIAPDDATQLRLLAGLAEAVHGAGDPARAESVFRDAIAVSRRCGPIGFAETVLRCANVRAEFGLPDVEMNALLEEALDALPLTLDALRARILVRLAAGLSLTPGAEARRRALADEATAIARRLGDPATVAFVLPRRLIALLGPDTLDERLETTAEMLATKTSTTQAQLQALVFRADDLAQRGDRAGLDQTLAAFDQQARVSRQPFFLWMAASFRTAMALLEGRLADAEALANEALSLGQRVQSRTAILYFSTQFFMLRGWQARFADIEPFIETSVTDTAVMPAWRAALAEFYAISGRRAEAQREFEALAVDGFAGLPRDTTWLTTVHLLADICWRRRDAPRAADLYELLRPFAGRIAVGWPLVVVPGSVDERLGMLATVLERHDAAEQHFTNALAIAERMRALPWQADIRHHWAHMLNQRGRGGDRERARVLLDEAEAIARTVGMALLLDSIAETREAVRQPTPARAVAAESAIAVGDDQRRGTVLALVPRGAGSGSAPSPRSGSFRCEGGVWSLVFEGQTTRVRNMVGLAHIARLLGAPEREIYVMDLATGGESPAKASTAGDAGELLDPQARSEYEERLRDARADLAEAEQMNDRGQIDRLTQEIEFLTAELSRSFGLGGRSRRAGAASERARVAVTRAIKYAIDRIAEHDQALAEHLRLAVHTGMFCSYVPPARDRVTWKL